MPRQMHLFSEHWSQKFRSLLRSCGVSRDYGVDLIQGEVPQQLLQGWQQPSVAAKQQAAFEPLLVQMRNGRPRQDFVSLADAVRITGIECPSIFEIGCGSGCNYEILRHMLGYDVSYTGLDYSSAMIALGCQTYPSASFVIGSALALPFNGAAADIVISGSVLMHLLDYPLAIQETRRVTNRWCIFHTIPVMHNRPTAVLQKRAYGSLVVEVVFNEKEFLSMIGFHGFTLHERFDGVPHAYLNHLFDEPVTAHTYLCTI